MVIGIVFDVQVVFDQLGVIGIDFIDVFVVFEEEGVWKFEVFWNELFQEIWVYFDIVV